jgi:glycosyltransferase involved in cell wall biosynthesis
MTPDISFVTSCYNSAPFVDGLLSNLLEQTHDNFEIVFVDSNSTDESADLAEAWAEKDERIRVIRQKERVPYGASWIEGWMNAKGRIVCNSNTDDRSFPWRATQVINALDGHQQSNPNTPCFLYGGYETRRNNIVTARGIPPQYSVEDMTQFFRCGVHVHWENRLVTDFNADFDVMLGAAHEYKSAFDYWLVLYFMYLGAVGVNIPSCFSIYNQRDDSVEQSNKELSNFESLRAIESFFPGSKAIQDLYSKTKQDSPEYFERYQEFKGRFE